MNKWWVFFKLLKAFPFLVDAIWTRKVTTWSFSVENGFIFTWQGHNLMNQQSVPYEVVLQRSEESSVIFHLFRWYIEEQPIQHRLMALNSCLQHQHLIQEVSQFLSILDDSVLTTYSTCGKSLNHPSKAIWFWLAIAACLTKDVCGFEWSPC